jgi:uncharacterized protein (TIGR03067 family)
VSRRLLLLTCLAVVIGFAPAPLPRARRADPEKDDLRKIQGTWVVLKYQVGGRDHVTTLGGTLYVQFRGGRMLFSLNDEVISTCRFELSPRPRRTLTWTSISNESEVVRGIYHFEGDRLILFSGGRWLIVMRRR